MKKSVFVLLGVMLVFLICGQANAVIYYFSQNGYTGGGVINGSFDAIDTSGDGQISSFNGEVTSFSLSFSGDSLVGDFTHTIGDLYGLVYDIGSGFIGDGSGGAGEGMASNWYGTIGFDYASGLGPTGGYGGRVIDIATGATSSSANLISVSAVPEPTTMLLLGLGLVGLAGVGKKFKK